MPNENLTAALQGSLDEIDSPLVEATPNSVDELLERINQHLTEGLPEKITDEDLRRIINVYRAQALMWAQMEEKKRAKSTTKRKPPAEAIDLDL